VALLQLISSGGGNIPTAAFLDDGTFLTSVIVADYLDPSIPLPPHQLIFNAIGERTSVTRAGGRRPPDRADQRTGYQRSPRVMKTGRISNARRLGAMRSGDAANHRDAPTSSPGRMAPVRSRNIGLRFRCCAFPRLSYRAQLHPVASAAELAARAASLRETICC